MSGPAPPAVDPRVIDRFRRAGRSILWAPRESGPEASFRSRVATLHEESARVDERSAAGGREMLVDSSPVGALVLVLEADRHGLPQTLEPVAGGRVAGFPDGALRAVWKSGPASTPETAWKDVVDLARYALR